MEHRESASHAPDYLESIFESSPVALISLNTRLRIIMFNRAAQELTGYRYHEVAGRRINRIIRNVRIANIIRTLKSRGTASIEGYITKLTNSENREIPVRLRISPLTDTNGNLLGVLMIASDLREIRKLQAKLLEAERLAAITETAISINHEINNPLCSILGNTQLMLMEREKLDSRTVRKLKSIEREIMRIREIAERLSRITKPVLKEYVGGKRMLDVELSCADAGPAQSNQQESIDKST